MKLRELKSMFRIRHVRKTKFAILLVAFCCAACVWLDLGLSRVVDPLSVSSEASVLSKIVDELDVNGIDVAYGKTTQYPLSPGRARVAPLAGFTPHKADWGSYLYQTWAAAFQHGVIGFVIAVPNTPSTVSSAQETCVKVITLMGSDVCEFVRKWTSTPPNQRIFIAFTKDDFNSAKKVADSLERAGYAVFLFMKGKDNKPWADPGMAGEVFAQAKHRFVIDTANARSSPGVAFESECCSSLLLPPPPITPLTQALQNKG
jgi:hypothetical protein